MYCFVFIYLRIVFICLRKRNLQERIPQLNKKVVDFTIKVTKRRVPSLLWRHYHVNIFYVYVKHGMIAL